jgi:hypothetical protein
MFIPPEYIRVVSYRHAGLGFRYDFIVATSDLDKVAEALVRSLDQGVELFVNDHRRDDSEGGLILVKAAGRVRRMVGGHGYSSDWTIVTEAEAIAEVTSTLAATMQGPQFGGGHFETPQSLTSSGK